MTESIRRELYFPQSRERVWKAITDRAALAEWMYPNNFEPSVGHRFQFHVPPKPQIGFDGLVVECEVTECEPPHLLKFSWNAGEPIVDTHVSFRLEPFNEGTQVYFEHSGFDLSRPYADRAFEGAQYGWAKMLEKQLAALLARVS
ncbi:SRPBCC domain-containing protein [Schlesneria sp. DSM 10557]|uniref:SRPBCC family protein n=1 Tax=Schlesneria sp. DSM 10557 TaxID=3044399 RepID=UPI0035A1BB6A